MQDKQIFESLMQEAEGDLYRLHWQVEEYIVMKADHERGESRDAWLALETELVDFWQNFRESNQLVMQRVESFLPQMIEETSPGRAWNQRDTILVPRRVKNHIEQMETYVALLESHPELPQDLNMEIKDFVASHRAEISSRLGVDPREISYGPLQILRMEPRPSNLKKQPRIRSLELKEELTASFEQGFKHDLHHLYDKVFPELRNDNIFPQRAPEAVELHYALLKTERVMEESRRKVARDTAARLPMIVDEAHEDHPGDDQRARIQLRREMQALGQGMIEINALVQESEILPKVEKERMAASVRAFQERVRSMLGMDFGPSPG